MIERKEEKKVFRRHIVGMLVENEPGVIAKISGLFSRRGFNMDTIVVGKTNLKEQSHIVVSLNADDRTIEQLEKQLYKLVDVVKLVDLGEAHSVVREHCLVKVSSNEKTRADLTNLCKLQNMNIVDVSNDSIIIEKVGSPVEIDKTLQLLSKYGIKELSRTGINALQRDKNNNK